MNEWWEVRRQIHMLVDARTNQFVRTLIQSEGFTGIVDDGSGMIRRSRGLETSSNGKSNEQSQQTSTQTSHDHPNVGRNGLFFGFIVVVDGTNQIAIINAYTITTIVSGTIHVTSSTFPDTIDL